VGARDSEKGATWHFSTTSLGCSGKRAICGETISHRKDTQHGPKMFHMELFRQAAAGAGRYSNADSHECALKVLCALLHLSEAFARRPANVVSWHYPSPK